MWPTIKKFIYVSDPFIKGGYFRAPNNPSARSIATHTEFGTSNIESTAMTTHPIEYSQEVKVFLEKAYKRYCVICDTFFKNNAGAASHKTIKHKA